MVARMMRWPRPPAARKFRVRLVVRRAEGLPPLEPAEQEPEGKPRVAAEVRWKGPRASGLSSLRRAVRRNRTREEVLSPPASGEGGGAVAWEEEFESVVTLAAASHREAAPFQPWELAFTVFTVSIHLLSFPFLDSVVFSWMFLFCPVIGRNYAFSGIASKYSRDLLN
jgi:hypothetical protein